MMQRWSFRLALGFLLTLAVLAALAPWLPLADPSAIDPDARLQAPAWIDGPVLGTDAKGRDLLARVIYGARISLTVGLLGSLVAILIGLPYGALAGMRGGRTDRFLMRLADLFEEEVGVVRDVDIAGCDLGFADGEMLFGEGRSIKAPSLEGSRLAYVLDTYLEHLTAR